MNKKEEEAKKKGIPKEIVDKLDIHKKIQKSYEITVTVEPHQAKIPIPKKIRLEMNLQRGAKCKIQYDRQKKELICQF